MSNKERTCQEKLKQKVVILYLNHLEVATADEIFRQYDITYLEVTEINVN